mgnify:CR=1 FL=1
MSNVTFSEANTGISNWDADQHLLQGTLEPIEIGYILKVNHAIWRARCVLARGCAFDGRDDLMTFEEIIGPIKSKVVTWFGPGNNMTHSWIHAASLLDFELRVCAPKDYLPNVEIVEKARSEGAKIIEIDDPKEAKDKDGNIKKIDKEIDNIINNTNPAWTKRPSNLKENHYKEFVLNL